MKKKLSIISLLFTSLSLIGCSPKDTFNNGSKYNKIYNPEWGDPAIFRMIEKDFFKFHDIGRLIHSDTGKHYTVDNVYVFGFFGAYDGSYVVRFLVSGAGDYFVRTILSVDGVEIVSPTSALPIVWNNHLFYKIPEAFELNLLKHDDLISIAEIMENNTYYYNPN